MSDRENRGKETVKGPGCPGDVVRATETGRTEEREKGNVKI